MALQEIKEEAPRRLSAGVLERAISFFSPGWASRRAAARLRTETFEDLYKSFGVGGSYAGANTGRPHSSWLTSGGSADADLLLDLPKLRERSRDLARNDAHGRGIVDAWVENVVGHGLVPQPRIDREAIGLSEEQAATFTRDAGKVWRRWAKAADVTGRLSAAEVQELLLRSLFENGDVFALPRRLPKRKPYSLAIQTIEADRVTTPPGKSMNFNIREGVVIEPEFGEHLSYWVKKTHPGDIGMGARSNDFVEVPALGKDGRRQVFHLYKVLRPDQSRGVPFLAAALEQFRHLGQYVKAELISAKVAACYAVFIVTADPYLDLKRNSKKAADGVQEQMLEPGTITRLRPGETISGFTPNRPTTAFAPFLERVLRGIGASVLTPYEIVSQDFSKTTYTSGRMALTEARRVYRKFQRWFAEKFLQPMWELLLEEAILAGDLEAPGFEEFAEEYCRCLWVGPGWSWVDPQKEVSASLEAVEGNLTTLADECASRGYDWEDVLEQRAIEKAREKELGIDKAPEPPPGFPGQDPAADPEEDPAANPEDKPAPEEATDEEE